MPKSTITHPHAYAVSQKFPIIISTDPLEKGRERGEREEEQVGEGFGGGQKREWSEIEGSQTRKRMVNVDPQACDNRRRATLHYYAKTIFAIGFSVYEKLLVTGMRESHNRSKWNLNIYRYNRLKLVANDRDLTGRQQQIRNSIEESQSYTPERKNQNAIKSVILYANQAMNIHAQCITKTVNRCFLKPLYDIRKEIRFEDRYSLLASRY